MIKLSKQELLSANWATLFSKFKDPGKISRFLKICKSKFKITGRDCDGMLHAIAVNMSESDVISYNNNTVMIENKNI